MRLPYIKQRYLDRLVRERDTERIRSCMARADPWLDEYFETSTWRSESQIDVSAPPAMDSPAGRSDKKDLENAIKIFVWLETLNPTQASDARLWACLSFDYYWKYMKERWPSATSNIDDRYYLLRKNTRCLIRHGISRLWWFAKLTQDKKRQNPFELTAVLLEQQDIQQSLLERSFGRSKNVLHGTLEFINKHPEIIAGTEENRKIQIQKLAMKINQLGGVTLLDALDEGEIVDCLANVFQ